MDCSRREFKMRKKRKSIAEQRQGKNDYVKKSQVLAQLRRSQLELTNSV